MTVDTIFEGGVFRPLSPVSLPENSKAKLLLIEPMGKPSWEEWEASAVAFQNQLEAKYGTLPDSTPIIAEMRMRDG